MKYYIQIGKTMKTQMMSIEEIKQKLQAGEISLDTSCMNEVGGGWETIKDVLAAEELQSQKQAAEAASPPTSSMGVSKGSGRSIMSRYTDSYLVARTITAFGAIVKIIAFVIGGGIIVLSIIAGSQSVQYIVGGVLLAAIVCIPIFILGILVSAQGQILKATLDTAVNSSPLLTKDEMKQIMSLD